MSLTKCTVIAITFLLSACAKNQGNVMQPERLVATLNTVNVDYNAINQLIAQRNYHFLTAIDVYYSPSAMAPANQLSQWLYKHYRFYPVRHVVAAKSKKLYFVITGYQTTVKKRAICKPWAVDDFDWYLSSKNEINTYQFRKNCTVDAHNNVK